MKLRGLYAVTPDWPDSDRLMRACEAVVRAGAQVLQLRRKVVPREVVVNEAHYLAKLCRSTGAVFIVNDDAALARQCDADGVHIGSTDGDVATARTLLDAGKLVGVSCYGQPALAVAAHAAGADYVAVGSVFASSTKPHAPVAGLDGIKAMRAVTRLPLVAIGGITRGNVESVRDAGADMAAIIQDVFESDDPGERAREIVRLWRAEDVCKK